MFQYELKVRTKYVKLTAKGSRSFVYLTIMMMSDADPEYDTRPLVVRSNLWTPTTSYLLTLYQ